MSRIPSLQLITDAVVAEYIHEISERHSVPKHIHEISERHSVPKPDPNPAQERGSGPVPVLDDGHRLAA